MTADPIPAEAVEAAARALYLHEHGAYVFANEAWLAGMEGNEKWQERARAALTAAAQIIVAQATADLCAGIEALRDEMPVLTTELCGHEPDEHPEGCCDVCDLAFAIDSEVRDRLDALLRGA